MTENKRFYYFGNGEDINSGVIDGDTELTLEETVGIMNELAEENKQLHRVIGENEKLIQSTYNELSKLRRIKESLTVIKARWNWIMESIDYD